MSVRVDWVNEWSVLHRAFGLTFVHLSLDHVQVLGRWQFAATFLGLGVRVSRIYRDVQPPIPQPSTFDVLAERAAAAELPPVVEKPKRPRRARKPPAPPAAEQAPEPPSIAEEAPAVSPEVYGAPPEAPPIVRATRPVEPVIQPTEEYVRNRPAPRWPR